jgi:hypothetical protein
MKVTSECSSIEEEVRGKFWTLTLKSQGISFYLQAMEAELDSVLGTAEAENMDTEEQAITGPEHAGSGMVRKRMTWNWFLN